MMRAVCFIVLCAIISTTSQAKSSIKTPPSNHQNEETCSYTVRIVTSCDSVPYTRDRIHLSFGDGYGTQVYARGLDDPSTRTFERCSDDTFEMYGPCTEEICYIDFYRSGYDGWLPESVEIYGDYMRPVYFEINDWIPGDRWYGVDYCSRYAGAAAAVVSKSKATVKKWKKFKLQI